MKHTNTLLSLFIGASLLGGSALAQNQEEVELVFSVISDDHPSEVRKRYREFHRIVEEQLNSRLSDKQARVRLAIAPSFEVGIQQMVDGEAQFARLSPVAYVSVKNGNPGVELLAAEIVVDEKDDPNNYGLIIVKDDSPVQALADLKGKSIAFVDPYASAGRYHAQEYLLDVGGLQAADFSKFDYLGRNDKVVEAVVAGEFDAGTVTEHAYDDEIEHDVPIRIVGEIYPVPFDVWAVAPDVPADIRTALQATLLEMTDPAMLEAGNVEGFVAVDDATYDVTRQAMEHGADYQPQN